MLEELQDQKHQAESQVSLLHNRIENLQARLDISSPLPSQPSSPMRFPRQSLPDGVDVGRMSTNVRHNSRAHSEEGSLAVEVGSTESAGERPSSPPGMERQGSDTLSSFSGQASDRMDSEGGEEEEEEEADDCEEEADDFEEEADDFVRLRSYVQHMQEGASLLLWGESGLQLCWFWVDNNCLSLNWDVDESAGGEQGAPSGDSLLLERVLDIVPLGAGPDQLTENPTDSSFTILYDDGRLDLVAPTSLDFQIWYFGLAFATRLRLNALREANTSRSTVGGGGGEVGREGVSSPIESVGDSGGKQSTAAESDGVRGVGSGGVAEGLGLSVAESHALLVKLEDQRRAIENLQRENQMLREVRRSKDEAISRLLQDLQAAEAARESESEGGGEAKTPATSMESDRNFHHRELFRVRRRNQKLLEIVQLKEAAVAQLWSLLQHCLVDDVG